MSDPILIKFIKKIDRKLAKKIQTIYLFGSRARHTERPDSDYDLLFIVHESFLDKEKDALYDIMMDILLETGNVLSLKIFNDGEFKRLLKIGTPFIKNVVQEGIKIG